jgi:ATP-dependent Lon protease
MLNHHFWIKKFDKRLKLDDFKIKRQIDKSVKKKFKNVIKSYFLYEKLLCFFKKKILNGGSTLFW